MQRAKNILAGVLILLAFVITAVVCAPHSIVGEVWQALESPAILLLKPADPPPTMEEGYYDVYLCPGDRILPYELE